MKNIFLNGIMMIVLACSSGDDSVEVNQVDLGTGDNVDNNDSGNSGNNSTGQDDWLVDSSQIYDGGPGKDGIPSIDNPKFSFISDGTDLMLMDDDLVIGFKVGEEVRAYPHFIMDYHEIVNDDVGDVPVAITYCPLTGTAIGWNRILLRQKTTFGVSGLIYNNNLIPYDRLSDSNWSQILQQCINGEFISNKPQFIKLVETTWRQWKEMYPETKVMNTNTGFSRNYEVYPYGDYLENDEFLIFPLTKHDERLPNKERVHAVINNNEARVFRLTNFKDGNALIDDTKFIPILVVGDESGIVSFELDDSLKDYTFTYSFNGGEEYFTDNEGNSWNIFGEAISGPRLGENLKPTISYMAFWFSIGAFFPTPVIDW